MKRKNMSEDTIVILGVISIVGIVAIATVALVYNRALMFKAKDGEKSIQIETAKRVSNEGPAR